jgi:DNA polymerase-3 subunit delta
MTPSAAPTADRPAVVLLKGDDPVVLRDAVRLLVDELVGSEERSLVVEELEVGAAASEDDARDPLVTLVDAAQTPPFLTEFRVVLGRVTDKRERNELVQPLVDYLTDPLPSTRLVLEWQGGRIPKALSEAVAQAGGRTIDTSPGRKVAEWVQEHLADADIKVDPEGRQRLVTWVGDEPSRLIGLIDLLRSTYGAGVKITAPELEPFLGDDGGVPPWDLTDAIDRGDRTTALELLQRMVGQGGRHPFQVLATLHTHFARMLRLDGADVTSEKQAAELLGMKGSTFPAKKAMGQARKLGHDRIVRIIDLLAEADLDLRGGKAWPDGLVLEVLVARIATMSR